MKVETACSDVVNAGTPFFLRICLAFQQMSSPISDVRTGFAVCLEASTITLAIESGSAAPCGVYIIKKPSLLGSLKQISITALNLSGVASSNMSMGFIMLQ